MSSRQILVDGSGSKGEVQSDLNIFYEKKLVPVFKCERVNLSVQLD